jgi:hypothetical protein
LSDGTDAMDRADRFAERKRAVGADNGAMPPFGIDQFDAG